jgi:SRSO17 transposase
LSGLIEWPKREKAPTEYCFSTLPADTPLIELVRLAKHRWIIERDYGELKQERGLGHFEGRGWRSFHHHATLCTAACGFLAAAALPAGFEPRGRPRRRRTASSRCVASLRRTIAGFLLPQLTCCVLCGALSL